ncbi:MAG: cobalamin-dependent protein, partial [Planctomycetes bacterium]|nr:cobalamin-dependent protein [Planctomycetota bacterium]
MRVLLIHPPYVPFRVPLNARPVIRPPAVAPLGIGSIAAVLRAQGHDVTFVDHYANDFDAVRRTVEGASPDVVGLPCLTEQRL